MPRRISQGFARTGTTGKRGPFRLGDHLPAATRTGARVRRRVYWSSRRPLATHRWADHAGASGHPSALSLRQPSYAFLVPGDHWQDRYRAWQKARYTRPSTAGVSGTVNPARTETARMEESCPITKWCAAVPGPRCLGRSLDKWHILHTTTCCTAKNGSERLHRELCRRATGMAKRSPGSRSISHRAGIRPYNAGSTPRICTEGCIARDWFREHTQFSSWIDRGLLCRRVSPGIYAW